MNSQSRNSDVVVAVAWNIAQVEIGDWRVVARLDGGIGEGVWRVEFYRRNGADSSPVATVSEITLGEVTSPLRRMFVTDATLEGFDFRFDAEHSFVSLHVIGDTCSHTLRITLSIDSERHQPASISMTRNQADIDVRPVHGTITAKGDSVRLNNAEPVLRSSGSVSGPRYMIGAVDIVLQADH
jgi:hypothetical protein